MSGLVIISKVLLVLIALGTVLTSIGGGMTLPPFKTLPWIQTTSSVVGITGACPRGASQANFFAFDSNWQFLQLQCKSLFIASPYMPYLVGQRKLLDHYITNLQFIFYIIKQCF